MNWRRTTGWVALILGPLLAGVIAHSSAAVPEPKRILLIHSYGHDFASFGNFATHFRSELARHVAGPVDFYDVSLLSARYNDARDDATFLDYLTSAFAGNPPHLMVPIGGSAVRFALRYRESLFPATPMLISAVDQRVINDVALGANDVVAVAGFDFHALVSSLLQVLPQTKRLAVVLGASPIERFWAETLRRELQPFASRVSFDWLDQLSFQEMKRRVAALPPQSAILYVLLSVDAAGVPHRFDRALKELGEAANAPIFGVFEAQLGLGIVGGPLMSGHALAEGAAEAAVRLLRGAAASSIRTAALGPGAPQYDWRALRRWNIDERSLPAGSVVRFRHPTLWEQYSGYISVILAIFVMQAVLIVALLAQRARRRRAEREALTLSGRLISAHEDERRRLGRELHDDLSQRLVRLAIDAAGIERSSASAQSAEAARSLRQEIARLSEDVHALSYRLHPSVIEDLGLEAALRAECESLAQQESIEVNVDSAGVPARLPRETALCVFRVAQEALRNVARHARATAVAVSLNRSPGGLLLTVKDNGTGLSGARQPAGPSLGHASMLERVRLLGGRLDIASVDGRGTTVTAWVPLHEGSS